MGFLCCLKVLISGFTTRDTLRLTSTTSFVYIFIVYVHYQKQYDTLVTACREKQKKLQEATSALKGQKSKQLRLDGFIQHLKQQDDLITDFNQ